MRTPDLLQELIQSVLDRVGLSTGGDGRPLYKYRLSAGEAESFRSALCDALDPGVELSASTCRAFCLWASDHYSRSYDGGANNWNWILEPLRFEENGIRHGERKEMVMKGMQFWRRDVIQSGRKDMLLATLIREGGIPRKLLSDDTSRVSAYFKSLFESVEEQSVAGRLTVRGEQLAEALALRHQLKRLAHPDISFLSADLVRIVREFALRIPKGSDPIPALDQVEPAWRDQLPLRLDDETAETFLATLLKDAVSVSRRASSSLRWTRTLRGERQQLGGWSWRIEGRLEVPAQIALISSEGQGASAISLARNSAFSRFVLETRYQDGSSDDWARGRQSFAGIDAEVVVHFDPLLQSRQALTAEQVAGRVELTARGLEQSMEASSLFQGGSPLSDDPWIFVDRRADQIDVNVAADGLRVDAPLVAQASCRVKSARAIVAVPDSMSIRYEDGTTPACIGSLSMSVPRSLYQIDRVTVVQSADRSELFRIRPAAQMGGAERIELEGRSTFFGSERQLAYLGVPQMKCLIDGHEQIIPQSELQWLPKSAGQRSVPLLHSPNPLGQGRLRWVQNGEVQHSVALTILPRHFAWSIAPSKLELSIRGLQGAQVFVDPDPVVEVQLVEEDREHVTLRTRAVSGALPTALSVRFKWGQTTIVLPFPYPGPLARFEHRTAGPFAEERRVALHQLSQYVAIAIRPDGVPPKPIIGKLVLKAGAGTSAVGVDQEFEQPFSHPTEDVARLPLNQLRDKISELFASTVDLDASVNLAMRGSGAAPVSVNRFDLHTELEDAGFRLVGGTWSTLGPREQTTLEMRAYDILDPTRLPLVLDRCWDESSTFRGPLWTTRPNALTGGMWIAALFDGDLVRSRPRLLPGESVQDPEHSGESIQPLRAAFSVLRRGERRRAIETALAGMSTDPLADEWSLVLNVVHRTDALPPATFDVLTQLVDNDAAVATCLVRAAWDGGDSLNKMFDALSALPFVVHGISRTTWQSVIQNTFESLERHQLLALDGWRTRVRSTRDRLCEHTLWIEPLWDRIARPYGFDPPKGRASMGADDPKFAPHLAEKVRDVMKSLDMPLDPAWLPPVMSIGKEAKKYPEMEQLVGEFPVATFPAEYREILLAPLRMAALATLGENVLPRAVKVQFRGLLNFAPSWAHSLHCYAFWYAGLKQTI